MHPLAEKTIPSGSVGIHWFGQNSFALKSPAGTILLIDPYFPHDRPAEKYIHAEPPLDEAELPVDFVLLTHDHSDHTCIESIERIQAAHSQARFVGPVESIERIRAAGGETHRLMPVAAGESVTLGAWHVDVVWSKPPDGAPADGIAPPDVQHVGYVARTQEVAVYVTGDLINTFANYDELVQPVAQLAPDVGLLTCHPSEGEFPYYDGIVKLATRVGLKAVVPSHYECFTRRTYDPHEWAAQFPPGGPEPLIIPYDGFALYPRRDGAGMHADRHR